MKLKSVVLMLAVMLATVANVHADPQEKTAETASGLQQQELSIPFKSSDDLVKELFSTALSLGDVTPTERASNSGFFVQVRELTDGLHRELENALKQVASSSNI